jgi:23S rRNA (pseudouridine1915-N3)-methyltransferase
MKITVAIHGKPKDKRILELMEEYKTKISRYQKLDFEFINTSGVEDVLEKYLSKKIYLLDEDGKEYTSQKFAEKYEKDLNNGDKEIVFVIGPAEGFGDLTSEKNFAMLKKQNTETVSLSRMAMQHDIAALVLVEQIYRAVSIKNNLPYHKN